MELPQEEESNDEIQPMEHEQEVLESAPSLCFQPSTSIDQTTLEEIDDEIGKFLSPIPIPEQHTRSNSDERPYHCAWKDCIETFSADEDLLRHYREHSTLKDETYDAIPSSGDIEFMMFENNPSTSSELQNQPIIEIDPIQNYHHLLNPNLLQGPSKKHTHKQMLRDNSHSSPTISSDSKLSSFDKSKQTESSSTQQHHSLTHTEKKFVCPNCGQTYARHDSFKRHMTIHNPVKNYVCPKCSKAFKRRDCLKSHMNVHNPDKNYVCPKCSKAFKRSNDLKSHMKVHNPDGKNFVCPKCSKAFRWSKNLNRHMKVHK